MAAPTSSPQVYAVALRSLRHLAWPTPFLLLLLGSMSPGWGLMCALLGLYQLWLNWRLQLDAALFAALAAGQFQLDELDQGLHQLFGRKPQPRPLAERLNGTRRLLQRYLGVSFLLWLWVLLALVSRCF